jgi:acetyl-CoA acyltransferase 2
MPFMALLNMISVEPQTTQGGQKVIGKIYLVHGKRTPFGKFGGSLAQLTPVDLAVHSTEALFQELNLDPKSIDQVIFANVIPSTPDTLYAGRHLALRAGMKISTPGVIVNRLCGSGIQALIDAARLIKTDEASAVLVAGAENMSMAPHLTYGARFGTKYGGLVSKDLLLDTLYDKNADIPMGLTAENLAQDSSITRAQSDQYSFESHQKAERAYSQNLIQSEISAIKDVSKDEHLRPNISLEEMTKLKPTFKKEGTVTAGSASGIVDGACSILVASEEYVRIHKLNPVAEFIDHAVVGVNPKIMGIGPVPAIQDLLSKQKMKIEDIDLFEINEAFAPQVMACQRKLNIPKEKLNVWGGAIATGHPLGATGLKISLSLSRQLKHYNKSYGIASACIGGGQGIALLLKRP